MLLHNWPSAFAHVDCDAFYASCERARRPELRAVPVCVLSNQSAFVIAKTYDAKKLGITTGMSVRDRLAPRARSISRLTAYYGQMSDPDVLGARLLARGRGLLDRRRLHWHARAAHAVAQKLCWHS